MKIALANDHTGYALKLEIKEWLLAKGHAVEDFGVNQGSPSVSYFDYTFPAAQAVDVGRCERGILIDGAGYPSAALAAVLPNVRPAVCHDVFSCQIARQHTDSNVLCLGGKVLGGGLALVIVETFLTLEFLTKYADRVEKARRIKLRHIRSEALAPRRSLTVQDLQEAIRCRQPIVIDEKTVLTPGVLDLANNAALR
ncbi:MAG: RpiB/LacA/LacB family sugar-phosphate isomerase [Candidatus Sumerlaeota bacterium]|nr:RpiB/LacA/LacB family sugar-phosphate isomerase [Candidatus Sumerlaeota bacterium]